MDANGVSFWTLRRPSDWMLEGDPPALDCPPGRAALRLARERRHDDFEADAEIAAQLLAQVPRLLDARGNLAWFDGDAGALLARPPGGEAGVLWRPPEALEGEVTDFVLDDEGVLWIAVGGRLVMHDRRDRWDDVVVEAKGLEAWRLAPRPGGGVWVLGAGGELARSEGRPLPRRRPPVAPGVARPCPENGDPPRLRPVDTPWREGQRPVALACAAQGELAVLGWDEAGAAWLWRFDAEGRSMAPALHLLGVRWPFSLAWQAPGRVALLLAGPGPRCEARVFDLHAGEGALHPLGDLFPLRREALPGPFLHTPAGEAPRYRTRDGSEALRALSFPLFARHGTARAARAIDGRESGCWWHRLFVEAVVPPGCGARIWLTASDDPLDEAALEAADWFEHRLGEAEEADEDAPRMAWEPVASELPHHGGLLPCRRRPGRAGLFSVLIQRVGRRVRALRGRYLYLRLELRGPGNATPELFALRLYGGRFSYVENYLPKLYRESLFPPESEQAGAATGADFLERYLAIAEGVMTRIEDRIARADLLTRPATAPAEALEWLAGWIGFLFEPGWSERQRRLFLGEAMELYRWHGTLRGLSLALDLATGGGVTQGRIVILESHRLRRLVATILGGHYGSDEEEDPLLPAGSGYGNSRVGDTLVLGDPARREFFALFSARTGLELDEEDRRALEALFDDHAHRLTLLVREALDATTLGMIERMAEREVPAHVAWKIVPARAPLLTGLSSLVGVDTYLIRRPWRRRARVGQARLGGRDFVTGEGGLDPDPSRGEAPVARAGDVEAAWGEPVVLDGSASSAAPGRRIERYLWRLEP